MVGIVERGGGVLETEALEQHLLIEVLQIGCAVAVAERDGEAADPLAFALVVGAVGKGGEQCDAEDGLLLLRVHRGSCLECRSGGAGHAMERAGG